MKHLALYIGIAAVLVASCSVKEENFDISHQDDVVFYASFEQPSVGTRVYANEDLLLRWTADDRVSIFNKNTYNQQYKFTGETGDNAGGFKKVDTEEFVTGNPISNVVSIYPYKETTKITESGVITVTLPSEQHYEENTFGLGANTMVSVSEDNFLQYKNVCGYLRLSLFGDGVSVSSIKLKGNDGEKLAGKATVTMSSDGTPSAVMGNDATDEIILICDTPIALGATADTSVDFWFAVPPVTFRQGFTVDITCANGGTFEKSTTKSITIERSHLSKMTPMGVEGSPSSDNITFAYELIKSKIVSVFDTNGDGELSFDEAAAVTSPEDLMTALGTIKTEISFDEFRYFTGITYIPSKMFQSWYNLSSIVLPESLVRIGSYAFWYCSALSELNLPSSVSLIGQSAFRDCSSLKEMTIPEGVPSIEEFTFCGCGSLETIHLPSSLTYIGKDAFDSCSSLVSIVVPAKVNKIDSYAFMGCKSLVSIDIPDSVTDFGIYVFEGCSNLKQVKIPYGVKGLYTHFFFECSSLQSVSLPESIKGIYSSAFYNCSSLSSITIPESVEKLELSAFNSCSSLSSITIPKSVTSIGDYAFIRCSSLTSITVLSNTPPTGGESMFANTNDCPIYVPAESVQAYKAAPYWKDYANRIQAKSSIPIPEAVDLGLPSGLKWASFNLGASKAEESGYYFAWGETQPKDVYNWSTYQLCAEGTYNTLTKYCNDSSRGYNGFTDGKNVLDLEDDAANFNLGGGWRMPTLEDITELINNCSWLWINQENVDGYQVTSKSNGNSIFLPVTGQMKENTRTGNGGAYYSSTLANDPGVARLLAFSKSSYYTNVAVDRPFGLAIRPVCDQ